jgi:urease accessory protein UreF
MNKLSKGSPELDEARLRQQAIGARLRQIFEEVVSEPVPDEFLEILRKADSEPPMRDGAAEAGHAADPEA